MSFPLIRPGQARRMDSTTRALLLTWLREECREAAERERRILTARAARRLADEAAERERLAVLDASAGFTPDVLDEAERVLIANRTLVAMGRRTGDGSRMDDLRAAHAAVARGGSSNGYLLALNREYVRLQKARDRAARAAMARAS